MNNKDFIRQAADINESGASRLHSKLSDENSVFAIISPCLGEYEKQDNKKRMVHLKSDVRRLGLGFDHFLSRWVEDGKSFEEGYLLISDIECGAAIKLGAKYDQNSIIYKDKDSLKEICTTAFETYKPGDIVRVFKTGKDVMSKKESFELYQVYDPRPSYFQTEPVIERIY